MALPGARVPRARFLESRRQADCGPTTVNEAVAKGPAGGGRVPPELIDEIADSVIKSHVIQAAGISFATGLPGGVLMAATIPADVAQFFWHAIVIYQKLAYLYGWPDLIDQDVELDEGTELRIVLLLGAMLGAGLANRLLAEISRRFAGEVFRQLPRHALTKTAYYPTVMLILRWVGVKITKQTFARILAKWIPVVGGALSAGATVLALQPMAKRLRSCLRQLDYARPA